MAKQTDITTEFILLFSVSALLLIGLLKTFSMSIYFSELYDGEAFEYLIDHSVSVLLALFVGGIVYKAPLSMWYKHSRFLLLVSFTLLFVVLDIAKFIHGYNRWLPLGGFDFLVSEFVKLFLVAYLASYIQRISVATTSTWKGFIKPLFVLLITGFLV